MKFSSEWWSQIANFMGPTWGPPGSCRPQVDPMYATWTLLSGDIFVSVKNPDSKVHGANIGPTWVLSAPDGPYVGPLILAFREAYLSRSGIISFCSIPLLLRLSRKSGDCPLGSTTSIGSPTPRGSCHTSSWKNTLWWHHVMETFSALLDICQGNPPVDFTHK